jgi:hypothetical protein
MNTNPTIDRRRLPGFGSALFSLALAAVLTVGCASVNRLREAQDSFNQAASAENAARFDANPSDTTASLVSARSGYASALLSLAKIESKDQASLQHDGLWGAALSLKSLCQWRLSQYEQALVSVEQARNSGTNQIHPRDRALLAALPGLIKVDQAYSKILNQAPLADVKDLLVGDNGAVANLQAARALVDKDHPVQIYLIQGQLAAYRNYTVALDRLDNHATVAAADPARAKAIAQLKELDRLLRIQKPGPSSQELPIYWAKLCGLPPL